MLGNARNRGRNGTHECSFGCCRDEKTKQATRSLKRRENAEWKKETRREA